MSDFGVILFYTTSSAMKAEKLLKDKGLNIKLIPTPRQFSSDCGVSLRFELQNMEYIRNLLDENNIQIESIQKL